MALPRITQKEMTEREQRELKTLLDRARIAHGRPLSNAETNSVKKEYIDKLMAQREAEAKKARQVRKQQAYKTDKEATFSWSANTPTRGSVRPFFLRPGWVKRFPLPAGRPLSLLFSIFTTGRLMPGVAALAFGLAFGFASEEEFSISLNRSISSSSVRSRHSPKGIPVRLTFMIRVRSSFVTS